ncbi:hypothetical protein GCM10025871_30350 [Deinococcus metallilatus]|nr:hypothetical protein GCM10025871_30350 [Deinococcus metallilatus]
MSEQGRGLLRQVVRRRRRPTAAEATERVRRGRRTSSPSQLGQVWFIAAAQARQKVHSKEQMAASPSAVREVRQRSQAGFIFNMAGAYEKNLRVSAEAFASLADC